MRVQGVIAQLVAVGMAAGGAFFYRVFYVDVMQEIW